MTLLLPDYPSHPDNQNEASSNTVIPRRVIDSVASSAEDRHLAIAGAGAFVPFGYGEFRAREIVGPVANYNGRLVMLLIWCLGEVEAIDGLYLSDGSTVPTSVIATHYTGSLTQGVDPTLAAAIPGWSNALVATVRGHQVGLAYTVVSIGAASDMGVPQFIAQIRGRKLYDPREAGHLLNDSSTWTYSTNPALALADLESSSLYGRGKALDWSSVSAVADDCDELVQATEARRTINLLLERQSQVDTWIDALSVYAGCFVVNEGGVTKLVSNRPGSVSRSITDDDIVSDRKGAPQINIQMKGVGSSPTVMRINYVDKSSNEWRDAPAYAYLSGALDGTLEWRESVISLPGIDRYSQAHREAVERLNMLTLTDMEISFSTHDEALQDQKGDIVNVSSSRGLSVKPFRVTDVVPISPGRWVVSAFEYQSNVFSDNIETAPEYSDTDLPSPVNPPMVNGLAVVESVYQNANGLYQSRLAVTWDDPGYTYLDRWDVRVMDGATLVHQQSVASNEYTSPSVQDLVYYAVQVRTVSTVGAGSAWESVNITAQGKYLVPGDVPSLAGFEVGGQIRLSWEPAIDLDIWRYEIRYVAQGGTWDDGILLDRVDALRLVSQDVPAGTWDFMCKALDSVGQFSATEARQAVNVTLDSGAYLVDSHEFSAPLLTNVSEYQVGRTDNTRYFVTDMGDSWASLFPNAMSTYSDPLATYHSSGASEFLTETWDIGSQVSGTWLAEVDASALSGSITVNLELSEDNVNWDQYAALTAKVTARYARIRISGSGADTLLATIPTMQIRVDAVPREENGSGTSSATLPVTISTNNEYAAVQSIVITPIGNSALPYAVDNITPGNPTTFDIFIFDENGTQVANDFLWNFKGV
ncbi:MAG: phage tail protein [Candidatus Thiodiazotropha lotti]|nr:phage tail protein [Candidatus Thiodiazotropha lotti]MCW4188331.1 phage tail protein [Candidatus Thiodiazotropha lotti]